MIVYCEGPSLLFRTDQAFCLFPFLGKICKLLDAGMLGLPMIPVSPRRVKGSEKKFQKSFREKEEFSDLRCIVKENGKGERI